MADKPFKAIDHGLGQIDLRHLYPLRQMRPTEIHHKADGSVTDQPSFAIVMRGVGLYVAGQISLEMFNDALRDIGYEIRRINTN